MIVPGFIDGHVHFFQTGGLDARPDVVPHPAGTPYREVVGEIRRAPQKYLRSYVCSGITGVVDPGGPMWSFDSRDAKLEDDRLSPRMAVSGPCWPPTIRRRWSSTMTIRSGQMKDKPRSAASLTASRRSGRHGENLVRVEARR